MYPGINVYLGMKMYPTTEEYFETKMYSKRLAKRFVKDVTP
jgi:hypothetical protein